VKESIALIARLHPLLDRGAVMNSQIVHDEKNFVLRILDQALHIASENLTCERFAVDHPAHLALVGYARSNVGRKTLGFLAKYRGLALGGVSPPVLTVVTHTGFNSPMDFGVLAFGLLGNGGVGFLPPFGKSGGLCS
jgi:hypothetical protein